MNLTYTGQKEYKLDVCGHEMVLPLVQVAEDLHIASFVMLGNVNCTNHCAKKLAEKLRGLEFDYIACPEAKVLPLAQALCTILGVGEYFVLRKNVKSYMRNPIETEVKSITTAAEQHLVIDGVDAQKIQGKKILLLDDVVSTGGTFYAMEKLLQKLDVQIVGYAAALKEGDGFTGDNLVYLADLPLFLHS